MFARKRNSHISLVPFIPVDAGKTNVISRLPAFKAFKQLVLNIYFDKIAAPEAPEESFIFHYEAFLYTDIIKHSYLYYYLIRVSYITRLQQYLQTAEVASCLARVIRSVYFQGIHACF